MPTVFKASDIETLADRLYSRGVSKLLDDSPSLQTDLRIASRVLRTLLGKIDAAAAKAGETAQFLADLRIDVSEG